MPRLKLCEVHPQCTNATVVSDKFIIELQALDRAVKRMNEREAKRFANPGALALVAGLILISSGVPLGSIFLMGVDRMALR